MPLMGFAGQLLATSGRQRVVLRSPVVLGLPPLSGDEPLLLELDEGGIERAVVERQPILARLLDPAGDPVAVQGAKDLEGRENHEGQRALLHVQLLRHGLSYWMPI